MRRTLLVVGSRPDQLWVEVMARVLQTLGTVCVTEEHDEPGSTNPHTYELIVIDAATVGDASVSLVARQHRTSPAVPIVVVTTSPTWQQAREFFLAGAADYVGKSYDESTVHATLHELIGRAE